MTASFVSVILQTLNFSTSWSVILKLKSFYTFDFVSTDWTIADLLRKLIDGQRGHDSGSRGGGLGPTVNYSPNTVNMHLDGTIR